MASRPSEPLLALIRKVARKRGLNTAALARAAELQRGHLKHVLAGSQPLTVDELIKLAQVLELGPAELGAVPMGDLDLGAEDDQDDAAQPVASLPGGNAALAMVGSDDDADPIGAAANPYGNQSEQILRLGLALGTDIHMVMETAQIEDSGVPRTVLSQYKERLPIRLDAAFHRHHDLRFLPEAVQITLSFDALYTCVFPWGAIQQITLFPLPPDLDAPEPEEEQPPEGPGMRRGHLRLVE